MQTAVSGFGNEFGEGIVAQNVDATKPENAKICQDLGFANHGLVIRSGTGEVLFKQADHEVKVDEVKKAIAELLAKQ